MVYENLTPKTETVYELKDKYKIPSFAEFMQSYEHDSNLNYDDLNGGDISEVRGYGPCSSSDCPYSSSFYTKIKIKTTGGGTQTYFRAAYPRYATYYGSSQWTRRETGFMWLKNNWEASWIEAYSIDVAKKFLEGLKKGYDEGIWISCETNTGGNIRGSNAGTKRHVEAILEGAIEEHERGESVSVDEIVKGWKNLYSPEEGAYEISAGFYSHRDPNPEEGDDDHHEYWAYGPGSYAGGEASGRDSLPY
jgi:hypothetical protein